MNERKYLKWYNKVGYGSGDLAANCVYGMITSFVMIYLTDTVGLNAGIIGTLIMFSKFFDGITDVFFGTLLDKTKSKLGKARPWMLCSQIGNSIFLVAVFAIPEGLGENAKYAYFFIAYTLLNAIFFTANNIAYASLTALITRNGNERVQMGSIRFMFSLVTNLVVSSITVNAVSALGGGATGWRNMAIIYGLIALIVNTIAVFSVKELPEEENTVAQEAGTSQGNQKIKFGEAVKLLVTNKYYIMILIIYIFTYIQMGIAGVGIYYMTYVLGNPALLGTFSMASMAPMIVGLAITPYLVKKIKGMYKVNLFGYILALVFRVGFIVAGYMGSIPLMLTFLVVAGFGTSPLTGTLNALIASASEYTFRRTGKRIDGTMFSCSSLGMKIGGGIGSAVSGWLLALGGYVANAAQQPKSAINMLNFMYLWFPLIACGIITLVLFMLRVEKANADWDMKHSKTN